MEKFGEAVQAADQSRAGIIKSDQMDAALEIVGRYTMECRDKDGNLKWTEEFDNLVVHTGKIDLLDKYLAGSAYTASFFLGLVDGASAPTYANADTMASHAGWTESAAYSNANRVTASFGAATATAGVGSKATSAAVFNINATATIAGAFLTTSNTKSGTTGTLYSAGSFSGGNRTVANGDSLSVTYTANC